MQIDNCEVWVDQPEMPGSRWLVHEVRRSPRFRRHRGSAGPPRLSSSFAKSRASATTIAGSKLAPAAPPNSPFVSASTTANSTAIGRQTVQLPICPATFRRDIAAARTFMLKEEADWLLAQGLGKRATLSDLLVFDANGPIENQLRFRRMRSPQSARSGRRFGPGRLRCVGHIVAHCTGHRLNAEMVRTLLTEGEKIAGRRKTA